MWTGTGIVVRGTHHQPRGGTFKITYNYRDMWCGWPDHAIDHVTWLIRRMQGKVYR